MSIATRNDETGEHRFPVRLTAVTYAARDAVLLELTTLEAPLPAVRAGSHLDLYLPMGQRQYSLVTPLCTAERYVIGVKRETSGRGGSRWLHDEARVGALMQIGHPRNNFALDESAEKTLLLAGGIGITPIYAMFARLRELGMRVELHYWSRTTDHALFLADLEKHPGAKLHFSDDPDRQSLKAVLQTLSPGTAVYCCGPDRMLDECVSSVPDTSRLHVERFTNAPRALDAEPTFTVRLARSGRDFTVAAGETVLSVLIEAGIDVPYSCEEGVCGACETRLLEGEPLHRDAVRSPQEHTRLGTFMICCSRSLGERLVLDI